MTAFAVPVLAEVWMMVAGAEGAGRRRRHPFRAVSGIGYEESAFFSAEDEVGTESFL